MKHLHFFHPSTLLDKFFEASVIVKGVEGVIETLAGFAVMFAGSQSMNALAGWIARQELIDDPGNPLAIIVLHTGEKLAAGGTTYLVIYLLVHGIIKLVATGSLLLNQLWGYPFSMITLGLFMTYQIYETILHHSWLLFFITIFDIFLMWLIYREFQQQLAKRRAAGDDAS